MKELLKKILKATGTYHSLQSFYQDSKKFFKKQYYSILFARYKGKGFTCNSCGASFSRFVDDLPTADIRLALEAHNVVAGYGENIICPSCLCTARERLVIAQLSDLHLKNKRILHLSPESSVYELLKRSSIVITGDINPGFYKSIDPNIQKVDITKLPFPSESFDLVIANHILEHIPDDGAALREIFRVLKPGTDAILQVPYSEKLSDTIESPLINDSKLQVKLYGQEDHVRIYSLKNYIDRLTTVGFKVRVIPYDQLTHLYQHAIQFKESFLKISKPISSIV